MIIEEYTVVVVKSKNYDTTVTDRIENDILSLDERQYDYYSVKDKNGSDIDFTAVKENNIITAVKNNRYIKAYVSDTVYTGIYYGVATELENHIQIGDETFEVALSYKNKLDNNLIGKNVTAYLDHFGNVAYMSQAVHNDYSVGFLIKSAFKSSVSKNDLKLKLLTSTGEIKVLSTRENFKIDNEFCKVSELKSAPLSLNKKEPIKYKVDENNEITEIDFPETSYSNDNDGFFRGNSISDVTFSNTNKMFGGKIELGENSIVFSIPENYNSDDAKDEDFRVVNFSLPNTKFVVDGYYFSTQSVYADVIVIKSNILTMDYDSPSGAITKITTVKNDEGINVLKVYYQDGNNEKTFYANLQKTPSFSSVTKGDSIQFSIDKNNYLTEFKLLYDISEKAFVQANPSASNYNDSIRYSMGYAAKINNGRVRLSKTSFFPDDTSVFEFDLYNTSQYFKTVVIENSLGNCIVRSGSFNEINVGDLLVIVMRNGIGKVIFIYKN